MRAVAPTILAFALIFSCPARAQDVVGPVEPDPDEESPLGGASAPEQVPGFEDQPFGPRYLIESVRVRGNTRTREDIILREVRLRPGDVVAASDRRVETARYRLLSLGYFLDARLSLARGSRRGGAVLLVEVEERGTLIVDAIHLGTSEATAVWGGLDVTETNFFGRGILLGGGFVASSAPTVPGAVAAQAFRLRLGDPSLAGSAAGLGITGIWSDGSELFQAFGPASDASPARFVSVRTRRVGGTLDLVTRLSRTARFHTDLRFEQVRAELPPGRTRYDADGSPAGPIDFSIHEGSSRVAAVAFTVDVDTRTDPVLPRGGGRLGLTVDIASPILGSSYVYAKGALQASVYRPAFRDHVLGFHLLAGALFGDAPYFDRFFIGDLNLLLPPRALGLNFSTLPSRDLLGTPIEAHRYDDFAARVLVEYAVPLWRRRGFVYGGDAFFAIGLLGLAGLDDLRVRDTGIGDSLPVDLTADLGVRLDTYIGIFTLSIANGLGRLSF